MISDLKILNKYPEAWKIGSYQCKNEQDPSDENRIESAIESLKMFNGCSSLLDIGCWSGLYSLVASRYTSNVLGLEPDKKNLMEAIKTKKFFVKHRGLDYYRPENVEFIQGDVFSDFSYMWQPPYDSILACNVTHHMNDKEIDHLKEMLSYVDTVVMQIRPHHKNVQNSQRLHRFDGVAQLLMNSGKTVTLKRINKHRVLVIGIREYPENLNLRNYPCLLNRLLSDDSNCKWFGINVIVLKSAMMHDDFRGNMTLRIDEGYLKTEVWNPRDLLELTPIFCNVIKSMDKHGYDPDIAKESESKNTIGNWRQLITFEQREGSRALRLRDGARRLAYLYCNDQPMHVRIEKV